MAPAIEDAYGGRSAAASQLQVSGGLLSRIGQLAASPYRKHARKLTGRGPTEISADNRDWLNKALPWVGSGRWRTSSGHMVGASECEQPRLAKCRPVRSIA